MTISEFLQKGYSIDSQLRVLEEHDFNTKKLAQVVSDPNLDLSQLIGDETDSWVDDMKVDYLIYDPNGDNIKEFTNPTAQDLIGYIHSL